jgi:glycosyltransferase involved in cell wall biosynthesis
MELPNAKINYFCFMRIAVNTQHLLKDKLEGIGWFAHETLSRMVKNHPEHEFLFIFDRKWDNSFVYGTNVIPVSTFLPSRHPFLWYWHYQKDIPRILKKFKPDLFYSPDGYITLNTEVPTVTTIHDINFMHRPADLPFWVRKYYTHYFPKFASFSKRIVTVSEFSKTDLVNTFGLNPDKVDVAYNGCNQLFRETSPEVKSSVRKRFTNETPYFIYVGSLNPRKNIIGLLEAFDRFRMNTLVPFKLLFAGEPMWGNADVKSKLNDMYYASDVIFAGRISTEVLQLLLSSSEALVMPSFFEGFGIPVIEAMYCEVPVICSNVTSLPEVAGDAALLIDPDKSDTITKAMHEIISNKKLKEELIAKGRVQREKFSWDRTAESVWHSIEKALE